MDSEEIGRRIKELHAASPEMFTRAGTQSDEVWVGTYSLDTLAADMAKLHGKGLDNIRLSVAFPGTGDDQRWYKSAFVNAEHYVQVEAANENRTTKS